MGVSIVVVYENERQLFQWYWMPLILKYPSNEVDFVFIDNFSEFSLQHFAPSNLSQLTIENTGRKFVSREDAVQQGLQIAKYPNRMITRIHAIPTYDTMLKLVNIKDHDDFDFMWMPRVPKTWANFWKPDRRSEPCLDAYTITKTGIYSNSPGKTGTCTMYDVR